MQGAAQVIIHIAGDMDRLGPSGDRLAAGLGGEKRHELPRRRMQVHFAHRHVGTGEPFPDPGAEPRHQQGIGAQIVEEVVVHRDPIELQEAHQDLGDFPLRVVLRLDVPGLAGAVARPRRRRQVLAVDLVAREHGQGVHPLEEGRQHVGWQIVADGGDDRVAVKMGHVMAQRVVGHQFDQAGLRLEGSDNSLGDPRHPHDDQFDLSQFDAVAADLDLGVEPAEILDLAVAGDAAQIASPVDPAVGLSSSPRKSGMKAFSVRSGRLT